MRIHEVASRTGLTPRAVRFYEERGLLPAARRTPNGYRQYDEDDIQRLRVVASLRELGLPVESIPELLDAWDDRERLLPLLDKARSEAYADWIALGTRVRVIERLVAAFASGGHADSLNEAAGELRAHRGARIWEDAWRFDQLADRFDAEPLPHMPNGLITGELYKRTLDGVAEWLDPATGEPGLDLGAGTGNLTAKLAEGGAKLSAVEQSAAMLGTLRSKRPGIDGRQGNLLALPWPDGTFGFVASTFALEHLTPAQQLLALAEADRVLRPGGRLAIAGITADCADGEAAAEAGLVPPLYPIRTDLALEWLTSHGYACFVIDVEPPVRLLIALAPTAARSDTGRSISR